MCLYIRKFKFTISFLFGYGFSEIKYPANRWLSNYVTVGSTFERVEKKMLYHFDFLVRLNIHLSEKVANSKHEIYTNSNAALKSVLSSFSFSSLTTNSLRSFRFNI